MNIPNGVIDKPNQFPWKLYDMLQTAENRNEEHIISWIRNGKAFKVHNRDLFIEQYMKKMFNQTKFKSFQRQLNLWGFERVQNGPDKGSYFHPLFVKGRRECCQRLSRVRLKGIGPMYETRDKSESPFSPHSASSTANENISVMGPPIFPSTVTTSSVIRRSNTITASPISSVGAFADSSQPTTSATTETSFQGASRSEQFADLIQYHTSKERREMIRNAAIGLSPDLSMAVVGTPVYTSATDTSQFTIGDNGDQRLIEEPKHKKDQEERVESSLRQQGEEEQSSFLKHEHIDLEEHLEVAQGQQRRRRNTSSGLEALLSVSAQRRREEELALLMKLSKPKAMSHMS